MFVAVLGTGMVYLDQTAVNVALPKIQVALQASIGGLQWIVDIYILTLATLLLIGGSLGDRFGRVRILLIGMVVFVIASIACGAAQSLWFLVAARAVQGIGGALLVPAGLALINATARPERRGQLIGNWAMFASMVVAVGPLLGGWLVDYVSWRAVFYINVPIGIAGCFVALRYVPESRNEAAVKSLDWPGTLAMMLGLGTLLFGLIEGQHYGWSSPIIIGALLAGVAGIVGFVVIEARSAAPMIPLHLFGNANFSGINLATLIQWMALTGVLFFLTLNLQQIQGYSAFAAGLAFLPISALIILLSNPAGKLTDRIGPRPLLVIGSLIIGSSFVLFAQAGIEASYWPVLFPATLLFGLGMGLIITPLTTVAMGALPNQHSGLASGVNNTASRLAFMLGIAIMGTIMAIRFEPALARHTARLPLEPSARAQLLAEARNLGATTPPANLSAQLEQATQQAIRLAFVDSFRLVMYVCAAITLASLGVILAFIRFQPANHQNQRSIKSSA